MTGETANDFPVGYGLFNDDRAINFQLNRWYSVGCISPEQAEEAGNRIRTFGDWKEVLRDLAETALERGDVLQSAFLYRAAEFHAVRSDPDKEGLYHRFKELFYRGAGSLETHDIPYGDAVLPALRLPAAARPPKGAIVIHGGFDSFMEEFFSMMGWFARRGYDAVVFDGPGQGGARKEQGLLMDYRWERPAKAVLDHFGLENVTWLGFSMGGYYCIRAAAFESRIGRVIASSVPFDYSQFPGIVAQRIVKLFFTGLRGFTNRQALKRMSRDGYYDWYMSNLMYITGRDSPVEALDLVMEMNEGNLHSERVVQDVLILTGKEDHTVPFKMHRKQIGALSGARSVTGRVFTAKEQAQHHCQIGNVGLALEVMMEWIESRESR